MLAYFIIGVALLVALIIGGQSLAQANPKTILKALRVAGVIILALLAGFLALTGRFSYAIPLALAALFLLRNRSLFGGAQPTPGQSSGVETEWLQASLDHDSGEMDALVLKGTFEGHKLSELSRAELGKLHREIAIDEQSRAILESFIQRHFPEDEEDENTQNSKSGNEQHGQESRRSETMNRQEALDILGLDSLATAADIKAAHRRLMKKFHPDHDGSDYMAARLNAAKDFLLKSS